MVIHFSDCGYMREWRPVPGYEGLYEVSNDGMVKSLEKYTQGRKHRLLPERIMKQWRNQFVYFIVALTKDRKTSYKRVHRLVAQAFIPNIEGKPYINHIDGNPGNNNVDNLEWCTQSENVQHTYDTGLHKKTIGVLSKEDYEYIQRTYKPYKHSARKIADELGVNESTVYSALHGRQKYVANYL